MPFVQLAEQWWLCRGTFNIPPQNEPAWDMASACEAAPPKVNAATGSMEWTKAFEVLSEVNSGAPTHLTRVQAWLLGLTASSWDALQRSWTASSGSPPFTPRPKRCC